MNNQVRERNVLFIGNGLDLNLGLRTSCVDFLESTEFRSMWPTHRPDLRSIFSWLDSARERYSAGEMRWVDAESELASYSKYLKEPNSSQTYRNEWKRLRSALMRYLANECSRFEAEGVDGSVAIKVLRENARVGDRIITFNYTDALSKVLSYIARGGDAGDIVQPEDVTHIHGDLKRGMVIFGVDDKADIPAGFEFLMKSTDPIYKNRIVDEVLGNPWGKLIWFGHSLGPMDHMYFRELFQEKYMFSRKNSGAHREVHFWVYGEDGYWDIHTQIRALSGSQIADFKRNFHVKFFNSKSGEEFHSVGHK